MHFVKRMREDCRKLQATGTGHLVLIHTYHFGAKNSCQATKCFWERGAILKPTLNFTGSQRRHASVGVIFAVF